MSLINSVIKLLHAAKGGLKAKLDRNFKITLGSIFGRSPQHRLPVWSSLNKNGRHAEASLTLYRQRFSLRKTHFLPLKRFLKCYGAKCH